MGNELVTVTPVAGAVVAITPMNLIEKAMAANASIEQMTQLFELQLRYESNEARKAFHQAVAEFKAESVVILKTKRVGYENKDGSFTGYSHATLGNIVQTIVPVMSKHGLSHSWDIHQNGEISVTCNLTHELGHTATVSMSAGKDDSGKKNLIQQVASTVTYLQRYTLLAITGLAAQDQDNDGKDAEKKKGETITEGQAQDLRGLMAEVKADESKFCVFYKVDSVDHLPADKYLAAVKALEAKRGA